MPSTKSALEKLLAGKPTLADEGPGKAASQTAGVDVQSNLKEISELLKEQQAALHGPAPKKGKKTKKEQSEDTGDTISEDIFFKTVAISEGQPVSSADTFEVAKTTIGFKDLKLPGGEATSDDKVKEAAELSKQLSKLAGQPKGHGSVLSNYYESERPFFVNGQEFHSVEVAYQFLKFANPKRLQTGAITTAMVDYAKLILNAKSPAEASLYGNMAYEEADRQGKKDVAEIIRQAIMLWGVSPDPKWAEYRDNVMYTLLSIKFSSDGALCARLLAATDAELEKAAGVDNYWGIGSDGQGQLKLKAILKVVKERMRVEIQSELIAFPKYSKGKATDLMSDDPFSDPKRWAQVLRHYAPSEQAYTF